ncbi:MAG: hypothetical protein JWL62_2963 [Hyphomicrobiales bacterium]|nr:hypothetical protein [Hyphomicrobiales bacterium]
MESAQAPFPWDEAMSFGLGILRHAPHDFWAMTPRELHRAIAAFREDAPHDFARADLTQLMKAFPDEVLT